MPKEPSLNQVNEAVAKKISDNKVECSLCGLIMKPQGFHNHKGSKVCARYTLFRPRIEVVKNTIKELTDKGKVSITRTTSNALERRDLEDITGLEFAKTEYGIFEDSFYPYERPWVYEWVYKGFLYYANTTIVSPNLMYGELQAIKNADDPEAAKNMAVLKWTVL